MKEASDIPWHRVKCFLHTHPKKLPPRIRTKRESKINDSGRHKETKRERKRETDRERERERERDVGDVEAIDLL